MADGTQTRRRAAFLLATVAVAGLAVACGRATDQEINQALGITPTDTAPAAEIATGTAAAAARPAGSPGSESGSPAPGAAVGLIGDVSRGRLQYQVQCMSCHRAGGIGGDLLAPGGPGAAVTFEGLLPLIREGTGHPRPPGPYPPTLLTDSNIRDLVAFIRSQAGG